MTDAKQPAVYIMANKRNETLYNGVTSHLIKRVYEHKTSATKGVTSRYNCKVPVWYELHEAMHAAIAREKKIKGGSRQKKIELIEIMNPEWKDLYETIL